MRYFVISARVFVGLASLAAANLACSKSPHEPRADEASATAPSTYALPPLVLKDDTANLLLTWVDDKGDFHVVRSPKDVPEGARAQVRVVSSGTSNGTGELVYVADLREKHDGVYAVKTMARKAWDEVGAAKRTSRMEAHRPQSSADAAALPEKQSAQRAVVIYGAKWCSACREAVSYFKRNGIAYLEKDIDESPLVKQELQNKLKKAKLPPTSSIPVLDVGGRILVGFNADVVRQALGP